MLQLRVEPVEKIQLLAATEDKKGVSDNTAALLASVTVCHSLLAWWFLLDSISIYIYVVNVS